MKQDTGRESIMKIDRLALLALAGAQRSRPANAQDLCTSRWFILARAYVIAQDCPWYLLSAKHGLIAPTQVIKPFEFDLVRMSADERRAWAERVASQAREQLPISRQILLLAGMKYRDFLTPYLAEITESVHMPLDGLSVGLQCSWLRCNTPGR